MKKIPVIALFFILISNTLGAQWIQTNGPNGGTTIAVAANDSLVVASVDLGTYSSEIFISSDFGHSWKNVLNNVVYNQIKCFLIFGNYIFAGSEEGLFVSSDAGETWMLTANSLTSSYVTSLTKIDSILFAGTYAGVFKSVDNGTTWTLSSSGMTVLYTNSINESGSNLFAATNGGGVYMSADSGATWIAKNNGLTNLQVNSLVVSDSVLIAGTEMGGVFYSDDAGNNWIAIGQPGYPIVSVVLTGSAILAGNEWGVFTTADTGSTWNSANTGLTNLEIKSMAIYDTALYACTYSGLHVSYDNGNNWNLIGLPALDITHLAQAGTNIYAGANGAPGNNSGVFLTQDNGESWVTVNNGLPPYRSVIDLCTVGSKVIASVFKEGLYLSNDSGSTWVSLPVDPADSTFKVAVNNGILYAVGEEGRIYSSTDTAQNWNTLTPLLAIPDYLLPTGIDFIGSEIYVSSYGLWPADGVFRSTDNGISWTFTPILPSNVSTGHMITRDTTVFVASSSGIFRSRDRGASWMAINNGIANLWVNALGSNTTTLFAGTVFDGSIFYSIDDGDSWICMNQGLPDSMSLDIRTFLVTQDDLFAGIGSLIARLSVVRRPLSDLTGLQDQNNQNESIRIYPNPAHEFLSILLNESFRNVDIEILNLIGQQVYKGSFKNATHMELTLPPLGTGIYFVKVNCGMKQYTSKLVIEN